MPGNSTTTAVGRQERGHAYEVARKELDGLIVLPDSTWTAIERGIAGEIDGSSRGQPTP